MINLHTWRVTPALVPLLEGRVTLTHDRRGAWLALSRGALAQIRDAVAQALRELVDDPEGWARVQLWEMEAAVKMELPPDYAYVYCAQCASQTPHACREIYSCGARYACVTCGLVRGVRVGEWAQVAMEAPPDAPAPPPVADVAPAPAPRRLVEPAPSAPPVALLVGCGKEKAPAARPAQALYTGGLTVARIRHARATGRPWAILSARHGLLRPEQEVAPYDLALGDLTKEARAGWAQEVAAQVLAWLGELGAGPGAVVEIHAGADYTRDLAPALRAAGYGTTQPAAGTLGQQKAWYAKEARARAKAPTSTAQADLFTAQPAAQWSALGLAYAAQAWHRYPSGATACAVGWGWSLGEGARAVLRDELTPEEVAALEGDGEAAPGCGLLRLHRVEP